MTIARRQSEVENTQVLLDKATALVEFSCKAERAQNMSMLLMKRGGKSSVNVA